MGLLIVNLVLLISGSLLIGYYADSVAIVLGVAFIALFLKD